MKNATKAQKEMGDRSVELQMRTVFSNLDALRRVDKQDAWEHKLRTVRQIWERTGKFEEWMQHIVDTCYEKVYAGRGYGSVPERKTKRWR